MNRESIILKYMYIPRYYAKKYHLNYEETLANGNLFLVKAIDKYYHEDINEEELEIKLKQYIKCRLIDVWRHELRQKIQFRKYCLSFSFPSAHRNDQIDDVKLILNLNQISFLLNYYADKIPKDTKTRQKCCKLVRKVRNVSQRLQSNGQ